MRLGIGSLSFNKLISGILGCALTAGVSPESAPKEKDNTSKVSKVKRY
jgi:hypothetical protein